MGACSFTLKSCIVVMSFLIWVATAGLLFVGIKVYLTYPAIQELEKSVHILVPAAIIIASGVFLFFVGLLGCFAAFKDWKGARATFFVLLCLIFVGEVVAASLSFYYKDEIKQILMTKLYEMVWKYSGEEKKEMDYIQRMLGCCGSFGYEDWQNSTGANLTVPISCCVTSEPNCTVSSAGAFGNKTDGIYTQGCFSLVEGEFIKYFWYIAGAALGFAIIQIVGLIATMVLVCRQKKQQTYKQLGTVHSTYK